MQDPSKQRVLNNPQEGTGSQNLEEFEQTPFFVWKKEKEKCKEKMKKEERNLPFQQEYPVHVVVFVAFVVELTMIDGLQAKIDVSHSEVNEQ